MLKFTVAPATSAVSDSERAKILAAPGFGIRFTDHMARATWSAQEGWHDAGITALEPFTLHPAAAVLHYAQEIFEGLKAYRRSDGSIWLFRPERNAARFANSAARLMLPQLPAEDFVASLHALVQTDAAWVPTSTGEESLYLRPFMVGTEAFLGVRPAQEVHYRVIASPAGPYFTDGVAGIKLWVSTAYTRAAKGGTGAAKCGGNYAASLLPQMEAADNDCDQVLYLDGSDEQHLEESGTMNLCIVTADGELITPGLGTILEGVTRDSVLAIAGEHGLRPTERPITLHELMHGLTSGSITEMFACGTAAVITPIRALRSADGEVDVADGKPGKHTVDIRQHLLDIQYGRTEDTRSWCQQVT